MAEFENQNKDIDLVPHEGFMDPKTFSAKLAGGQLEDVFYVYFTDPAALIARKQAADLTDFVKDVPNYGNLKQELKDVFTVDGKVYGLPTANYTMGLLYSRTNFTKAGLDPNSPPKTWDEVRAAAKKLKARASPDSPSTARATRAAGTSPRGSSPSAVTSPARTATPTRPTSTTTRVARSCAGSRRCAGTTTPWARSSSWRSATCRT